MNTPVSNPLDNYPSIRSGLYLTQWIVTGIQTVLSAFFAFQLGSPDDWPRWFLASLAVAPVLWAYLGITAQTNVESPVFEGAYDGTGDGALTVSEPEITHEEARWAEDQ